MPFVPNTPESLVARTDSKNPRTTCRGITANGRPCRRSIIPSASPTILLPGRRKDNVFIDDPSDESLYCWQHKEQASHSAKSSPARQTIATSRIPADRTSLDSLADRLGLVELEKRKRSSGKGRRRRYDDSSYDVSLNGRKIDASSTYPKPPTSTNNRHKQSKTHLLLCCFSIPLEEVPETPQPRPKPRPRPRPQPNPVQQPGHNTASAPPKPNPSAQSPGRSSRKSATSTTSPTGQYLSLIPPDTDPQTASSLMAELARPYVDSEEPGYIYMFWMTPSSQSARPPVDAARSLLAPSYPPSSSSSATATARQRRPSDVVSSYARNTNTSSSNSQTGRKETMLIKIGRATNVQRRMQQWSRQCGYDVEVIRYYPYLPSSGGRSPGQTPRMTPHCHRVERLVNIELAGMGLRAMRGTCEACGREHREWFEVEASRRGIRAVDQVIRRWVAWDEKGASTR